MVVFAVIGFLLAIGMGLYFLIGGLGGIRVTLAFTGTLKSADGTISIIATLLGVAILAAAIYFMPFHVRVSV